ncbi:adhesion G protein-coupled receptor E1-like [Mixophyes fleayi]|uniref:adhesion G protein-coupled receptor E1-like n=1 Tax=Mixophyes fleayi TaxID=3061075 RepID=UPI003F4D85BC
MAVEMGQHVRIQMAVTTVSATLLSSVLKEDRRTIVTKAIERFTEVAKSLTVVLVDANILSIANSSQRGTFFTQILDTVEATTLLSFTTAPRNQNISTTNIDISMMASRDHCIPGVQFTTLITSDNIMQIPCSLVPGEKDGSIFITYKGLDSGLNGNILITQQVSVNNRMAVVNSRVVTGAITTPVRKKLSSPVIFRLSHLKDLEPFHMFICVFWDSNNKVWSDKGCTTEYYNNTHSTCTCSHFSSFAVIMAPHEIEDIQDHLGLIILSHIGLSISLLCLCLSLLTFILCRSLRSVHTSVLSILCGCLFLGQLLFLVGLDQTFNKVLCAVIAGGLQFLFLCAFCWMCIESILLFMTVRNLRALNYMTSRRSNFPVMCLLGFGVPAVIVGISAAVRPLDYGSQRYCWLHSSLRWSFLGPVCVFIIVNTILLALTIFLLRIRLASLNTNVSSLKNTRLLTFKALAQVFILGCTWSIGFFQFGSGSLVISYLFTICNSLQGAYIFLVHCLLNHQVREEYRRLFRRFHTRSKPVSDVFTSGTLQTASRSTNISNITKPAVNIQKSSPEMKAHWV